MIWTSLENTCSQLVKLIHPTVTRVIAYQNNGEPVTPYCVINVKSHDAVTRQEVSTFVETVDTVDVLIVKEVYEVVVTFGFIASENGNPHGGDLLDSFVARLSHPQVNEWLSQNGLSYMRKGVARRVPKLRETKWYSSYEIDVQFAYYVETSQTVDYIESISVETQAISPAGTLTDSETIKRNVPT